jgi:hypothetical protein
MGDFDPYYQWLGIPPSEQPPNHYRLLGLSVFENDPGIIDQAARRQIGHVRECSAGQSFDESQYILDELSVARACLLDRTRKKEYDADLQLQFGHSDDGQPKSLGSRLSNQRPVRSRNDADDEEDVPYRAGPAFRTRERRRSGSNWIYWLLGLGGAFLVLLVMLFGAFVFFMNQRMARQVEEIELASDTGNDDEPELQEPADLLKIIDIRQNTIHGNWRFDGDTLVSPDIPFAMMQIPVKPAPSYIVTATVEASSIQDCFVIGLVVGSRQVTLAFNGFGNTASGLQLVDRKIILRNETKTGPIFVAGRPNHVICRVTPGRIEVSCDGRQVVNWAGDFRRLLAGPDWQPPMLHRFFIGSYLTSYRISELKYEPIGIAAPDDPEGEIPAH